MHNEDPFNVDASTWGATAADRGRWTLDGPTWAESDRCFLFFEDLPGDEPIVMKLHCEAKLEGQKSWYTGEDPAGKYFC